MEYCIDGGVLRPWLYIRKKSFPNNTRKVMLWKFIHKDNQYDNEKVVTTSTLSQRELNDYSKGPK